MRSNPRFLRRLALAVGAGVWFVGVGLGLRAVWSYETAPGRSGRAPGVFPSGSAARAASGRPTLLLLAHPRCPCTRSTVEELAEIMARAPEQLTARVLFYRPAGAPDAWAHTDLWRAAAAIPGVQVATDPDGAEARRFGARTSGHALLYGADGHLLFSGGITDSRSHAGESTGSRVILALCAGGATAAAAGPRATPVYGCSLMDPVSRVVAKEPL